MRRRRFVVPDPIFQQGLDVTIGGGIPAFEQHIRRRCSDPTYEHRGVPDPDGVSVAWLSKAGRQGYFLYLRSWDGTAAQHATLAHEALHWVQHMMQATGVDDDEAAGYLLGFIVREILDRLARRRPMAKRKMAKPAVKKAHAIARKVARRGDVENPYAVGMAAEKKHLRKTKSRRR